MALRKKGREGIKGGERKKRKRKRKRKRKKKKKVKEKASSSFFHLDRSCSIDFPDITEIHHRGPLVFFQVDFTKQI